MSDGGADVLITFDVGGDTADLTVNEGQSLVTQIVAHGAAGSTITYSITGGTDAGLFEIDLVTGELFFASAPDFETPGDSDGDNVYEVIVTASDGVIADSQTLSVTVEDRSIAPRLIAPSGFSGAIGGDTDVILTSGFQSIGILDVPGTVTLIGPPGGDDVIRLSGNATDYTVQRVGSRVEISDGDTAVSIPISPTDINIAFVDGPRTLGIVGPNVQIGTQVVQTQAGTVIAPAEANPLPDFADPNVRGRLVVSEGSPVTVAGSVDVFGTGFDVEAFTVAGGDVAIRAGFTGGNDTVGFDQPASKYTATRVGSAVIIAGTGTSVSVPISPRGTIVTFPDEQQSLRLETGTGKILLGNLEVTGAAVQIAQPAPMIELFLAELDGTNGFVILGNDPGDLSGLFISSIGDFNGDGIDDVIVGATQADPGGVDRAGESYVIFGSSTGFDASLSPQDLNGSNGFRLEGIDPQDVSGIVSSAGDFNGDGLADLIVGAPDADPDGRVRAGESYVVFGRSDIENGTLGFDELNGSNGFVIKGIDVNDFSGISVSSAGDINGDGFDDLLVAAYRADQTSGFDAGEQYVVFGRAENVGASLDLSSLDGESGFQIMGIASFDQSGFSIGPAGDVNGDGFADLVVGAPYADPKGLSAAGQSYVVFGSANEFEATLDLANLDGNNGFIVEGRLAFDNLGFAVSGAGDFNGDGFDDLILGALNADPNGNDRAGETYVIFGMQAFSSVLSPEELDGTKGFVIEGKSPNDLNGISVSKAGDVNGDGFDDLLIGASRANSYAGETYVLFGTAQEFGASINLASLDGTNGFVINGVDAGDQSGRSVASAGDVNRDGFDDLIIGAPFADPNSNSNAGESYVVFGGATGTENRTPITLHGTGDSDKFTGNAGDDTFTGMSTADVVRGGAGDDSIAITTLDFADIRGGHGTDLLVFEGAGLDLDLTTTPRPKLNSIEAFDLTGTGDNSLTVSEQAIYQLTEERSGGKATVIIKGDAGDSVEAAGFTANGTQDVDGITYNLFEMGNAQVLVDPAVALIG